MLIGTLYGFSTYSVELEAAFEGTGHEHEVDVIGSYGDFGTYSGFLLGMISDKFGTQMSMSVATLLLSGSYLLCYLMLNGSLDINYSAFCFLFFCIGQGSFGFFISIFSANSKNFAHRDRAKVLGYFLAIYGLSAMILTLIYQYVDYRNINLLFLQLFVTTAALGALGAFYIRIAPSPAALSEIPFTQPTTYNTMGEESTVRRAVDITGMALFASLDFWLLFTAFFFFTGPCLMWKNSIGTIGEAFSMTGEQVNALVYGWSGFNSFFRLVCGFTSDYLVSKGHKRAWLLIFAGAVAVLFNSLYLVSGEAMIWPICISDTIIYAFAFTITSTQISTYFGTAHFGFNMGMASLAPAVSGLVCTSVSTMWVNAVALAQGYSDCLGEECFDSSFTMCAICFGAGLAVEAFVLRREPSNSDFNNIASNEDVPLVEEL